MLLNYAASIASLIGLAVTIVTFCKLRKTSVAVDEAKKEVIDLNVRLVRHDLLSILNVMIKDLELIKQQNFTKIDSLAQLRHSLIRFKESYPGLEKGQEKRLNDCIGGLNRMEKNGSVSKQEADALIDYVDGLVALASNLRKDLGGEK